MHAVRAAIHHRRHLDRVLHRLQTDPNPGKPAERKAVDAVIQYLLHPCRADHRHIHIDQRPFGLMQHGRAFARMVIAHRHQHAAMLARAGHVGMAHHIARSVDARPLAVPQAETRHHSLPSPRRPGLLAAPQRSGGQILVQPVLKGDVAFGQLLLARDICRSTAPRGDPR